MDLKEEKLFKSLCSFQSDNFDAELLDAATPTVLGHLFFNRMQAIAYGTLVKHDLTNKVNREFRNSLMDAYLQNCEKNKGFISCVEFLNKILSKCDRPYAMLKGAYLCQLYPIGYRTANDIDLLVSPEDVTEVGNILLNSGFKQGYIRGGKFVSATRREIIGSKMMRGETVPFILEVNLPGMKYLEVDINFSLGYKPSDSDMLEEMLKNTVIEEKDGFHVRTLRRDYFFIHLCAHLYKEATTLPWIEMMRDMTMYKYSDIYMLLNNASKDTVDYLFTKATSIGMEKICAFAVKQMSELFVFTNTYALLISEAILKDDPDFIHTVISPKEEKKYRFTEHDVMKRLLADSRKELLKEVIN